jgi:3alpha(or 20beta)-hydroxysteroid dehydrogenase
VGDDDGKAAIVTGAASGQGAAEARLFVELGARVVLGDVRDEDGHELARSLGDAARYVHHDVTSADDWQAALAECLGAWGRLDVLVNNAGIWRTSLLEDEDPEAFERVLAVNLRGPFLGIRAAVPAMREGGGGSIVNIASIAGMRGLAGNGAYGASKWGLRGLTKVAAAELGPSGIRVNAICPGVIDTPMIGLPEEARRHFEGNPLRRVGRPEEVARLAAFLASDASAFVSGGDPVIDGGSTATGGARPA